MWKEWMLDASCDPPSPEGPFTYCPVERVDGGIRIITGMMVVGGVPDGGRCIGVYHPDGDEAATEFYNRHEEAILKLLDRMHTDENY